MKKLINSKAIQPIHKNDDRDVSGRQRSNFWEFVDSRVQSQEQIIQFCSCHGLELIKKIASGGFGSVYQAQDVVDGRKLVLKVLDFSPHQSNITTKCWVRNKQIYVEVYVELHQTLQEILVSQHLGWDILDLIPFLITHIPTEDERGSNFATIKNYKLVEYLCREEKLYELRQRANDYWLADNLELWLAQFLDNQKVRNLSIFDLLNFAPDLIKEEGWNWQKKEATWLPSRDLFFPFIFPISLKDLVAQSRKLFGDHGRSLLRELLWDLPSEETAWRFSWVPQDFETLNPWFSEQILRLETLWNRYSIKEIQSRWPEIFQLQITRRWPAGAAISYLQGEIKTEVKRLLAIKHEMMAANALQQTTPGFNTVLMPPQKIGDNLVIVSEFLYDWQSILPNHLINQRDTGGDDETVYTLAFSTIIPFLYEFGQTLLNSSWLIGDLKPSNFKMNLSGEWKLIDYGGHCLKNLDQENPENIIGSNDYASYALFHLLNAPGDQEYDNTLIKLAQSLNSSWFSLVKVIVRMMTGRMADYLRAGDLNRALLHDFQGYHEAVFQRLYDGMIVRQDSPYHYRRWSLVIKDVANLFAEDANPGLEATLKRLLFVVSLTLTGTCTISLLDEEMQQRIVTHYNNEVAIDSTWTINQESNKIIITEFCQDAVKLNRLGLHPREALRLLELFFPNIKQAITEQHHQIALQQQILNQLQRLGVLDLAHYFDSCQNKYFATHILESLQPFAEINWLRMDPMKAIVAQNPNRLPNFPSAHLQKLQSQLVKWLQQQQPTRAHWEGLQQLIGDLLEWQTWCFQQYLHLPVQASNEQLTRQAMLFLMNRWAMLQYAWDKHQTDLLDFAMQNHWIEKHDEAEMNWLANQILLCESEIHVRVILNHELQHCVVLKNIHTEQWQNLLNDYRSQIRNHPFFPLGLPENWHANDVLEQLQQGNSWFSILSFEEQQEWNRWCSLIPNCINWPWADAALAEKLVILYAKGIQAKYHIIWQGLKEADLHLLVNAPKNLTQWKEVITSAFSMLQKMYQEPERFIPSDIFKQEPTLQSRQNLWYENDILFNVLEDLIQHFNFLQKEIHCHFFMSAMGKENLPLEYIYQKLKKLSRYLPQDQELVWISTKIQTLDANLSQRKIGRWYAMYHHAQLILEEMDTLCHRWSDYANSQGWALTTIKQVRYTLASQEVDDHSLLPDDNLPKVIQPLLLDQLRSRVARFFVRAGKSSLELGHSDNQAFAVLLALFLQHGLLLSSERLKINSIANNLYQTLRRHTGQFQNLPASLLDIKKLAATHYHELSIANIRGKFNSLIPDEVKEPLFTHSILLEFLDCYWQNYYSNKPNPENVMRKKILVMQLQRERQNLQAKYAEALQQYPEHLLVVMNLSLIHKEEELALLLKEAQDKWPLQLQIFKDYLAISQQIIEEEKKIVGWNGLEFLRETNNAFLQAMYPELKNQALKEIYIAMLSLNPLPNIKDIREFLQKCYHFHLQQEQHHQLHEILTNTKDNSTVIFELAKKFLDTHCIPCAEEEIQRLVERIPVEEDVKKNFLQQYLTIRQQLPVARRIQKETRFVDKLHHAHPQDLEKILLLELWLAKFQLICDAPVIAYFSEAFEHFNEADQNKIYESLSSANNNTDTAYLFHWLFEHYIFQPTLLLLDSASIFESKASDQILNHLATKYQMQRVPTAIQWQISRTIKEKISSGILTRQQIIAQILNLLDTLI